MAITVKKERSLSVIKKIDLGLNKILSKDALSLNNLVFELRYRNNISIPTNSPEFGSKITTDLSDNL